MSARRITITALALLMGFAGAAQAGPMNIFSASKATEVANGSTANLELVHRRYYRGGHYRRGNAAGAAFALGAMGVIGGIAASAAARDRYYCDPYYDYCGRRYYRRGYYAPRYYAPRYYAPRHRYRYY